MTGPTTASSTLSFQLILPGTLRVPACHTCPYMEAGRCEGAITRGSAELDIGPGLIGCHDPERIRKYYDYLRNVEPISPQTSHHNRISLPYFIPVLESGMPIELELNPSRLYGVYLRSIIDCDGHFKYKTADSLRKGLRLSPNGRLALFVTATDTLIERAWAFSEDRDIWQRLAGFDFEFVTSATFSVYEDEPRSDQIYNQDRNFRTYEVFCKLGVPCIPFLFFNQSSDLDYGKVINWLMKRQDIQYVAILAHSYKHERAFHRMLIQTRTIARDAGRSLQFVFVGASTIDKVRLILSEYSNAILVSTQPVSKARAGERIGLGLKPEKVSPTDADRAKLTIGNIQQFDNEIDAVRAGNPRYGSPYQEMLPFELLANRNLGHKSHRGQADSTIPIV